MPSWFRSGQHWLPSSFSSTWCFVHSSAGRSQTSLPCSATISSRIVISGSGLIVPMRYRLSYRTENSLHWSFSMLDSKRAYTKPQREQPDSEMKNVPVQNPCCIKGGIRHLDYFGQQWTNTHYKYSALWECRWSPPCYLSLSSMVLQQLHHIIYEFSEYHIKRKNRCDIGHVKRDMRGYR